jgi:hypothetical protein
MSNGSSTGKVGTYAIVSINFDAWFKNEGQEKPVYKPKKKNSKKTIYPFLLKYSNLSDDIFWNKKFNIWANGKLPKNFLIENEVIYFMKGKQKIECVKTGDDFIDLNNCIDFFKCHAGLFSKKDESEAICKVESESSEDTPIDDDNWSGLSKKTQEWLVRSYVVSLATVMDLSIKEKRLLLQTIRLGIAMKVITKSHINMDKGAITTIKGLLCDQSNNTKIFTIKK